MLGYVMLICKVRERLGEQQDAQRHDYCSQHLITCFQSQMVAQLDFTRKDNGSEPYKMVHVWMYDKYVLWNKPSGKDHVYSATTNWGMVQPPRDTAAGLMIGVLARTGQYLRLLDSLHGQLLLR